MGEAPTEPFFQTEPSKQFLQDNKPGERGKLLFLEFDGRNRMDTSFDLCFATFHLALLVGFGFFDNLSITIREGFVYREYKFFRGNREITGFHET
jgi:hypothetical protein